MTKPKKLQLRLPKGYETFNGVKMTDIEIKNYNRMTDDINAYLKLGKNPPEQLLDARHKYFNMVCRHNMSPLCFACTARCTSRKAGCAI